MEVRRREEAREMTNGRAHKGDTKVGGGERERERERKKKGRREEAREIAKEKAHKGDTNCGVPCSAIGDEEEE